MSTWQPDPVGRHQERLHDGVRWTDQVRDHGVVNRDAGGLDAIQPPAAAPMPPMTLPGPSTKRATSFTTPMSPGAPPPPQAFPSPPSSAYGAPGNTADYGTMVPSISSSSPPPMAPPGVGYAPVGPASGQASGLASLGKNSIISGLIAGAIGGGVGAAIAEVLYGPDSMDAVTDSEMRMQTGIYVMLVGIFVGFVIAAWPAATSSAWPKALRDGMFGGLAGAVAGFIGGYVAQILFKSMLEDMDYTATMDEIKNTYRLARMAAWGVFGAAMGLGLGLRDGVKKSVNGLVGGAIGGALGGLIFQQIEFSDTSGDSSGFNLRLAGMIATGIGIGLGIGIVDRITRSAWLQLTSGPLRGREVILFKEATTLGSDPRCDLVLANDPTVAASHATFQRVSNSTTLLAAAPVAVNGMPVHGAQVVRSGDVVQVGSTSITYVERASP